jgi:hypothetical protein
VALLLSRAQRRSNSAGLSIRRVHICIVVITDASSCSSAANIPRG